MDIWLDIAVILLLIGLNGFCAMSEMAVLSARKSQLQKLAAQGKAQARAVLAFREDSSRFLASIQIGITLVGMLTGVFSGATLAARLAGFLAHWPLLAPFSPGLAMLLMVLAIGFASLILGELVPKQIGLRRSLAASQLAAGPIGLLSRLSAPLIQLLSLATESILRFLQLPSQPPPLPEEEILLLLEEGKKSGTFDQEIHSLLERVFDLSRVCLAELMLPRRHLVCLDLQAEPELLRQQILKAPHTCYPAYQDNVDHPQGLIYLAELLPWLVSGESFRLASLVRPALYLSADLSIYRALQKFRQHRTHEALVFDQHGMVQGMVSLRSMLDALLLPDSQPVWIKPLESGAYCVEADIPLDRLGEFLGLENGLADLPQELHTLAGLVLHLARKIPAAGEVYRWRELELQVLSLAGPRILQVRVSRQALQDS